MKTLTLILLSLVAGLASAQTPLLTFTNISGDVYNNVRVVKMENDGVLFGLTNWQYARVKFTNMSASLQTYFGYDPEKIRRAQEVRLANEKAARDEQIAEAKAAQQRQIAEAKAAQIDSIKEYADKFLLYSFDDSDFPKTEGARQACKEIVSELKGINKALELGCSYNKFSELLTDKVLAVEKIKDLRGDGIPRDFLRHIDGCVNAFKESRHWWNEKIQDEFPKSKLLDEQFMRDYWSEADLRLICSAGIAESNTNAISLIIDKMAEMIKDKQDAVKEGVLEAKGNFDPNVQGLSSDQISVRLKKALAAQNASK